MLYPSYGTSRVVAEAGVLRGDYNRPLWQKLRGLFGPSSLVSVWGLDEGSGVTAVDKISALNGTYRNSAGTLQGVTLAQPGLAGQTCILQDGTGYGVDLYGAGLVSAFPGQEGFILALCKVTPAAWTDGAAHYLVRFYIDASNNVTIYKSSVNNQLGYSYTGGGTGGSVNKDSVTSTGWLLLGITWSRSNNVARGYFNGTQVGTDKTVGTWTGSLGSAYCVIGGSRTDITGSPWKGNIQTVILGNRLATPAEMTRTFAITYT